MLSKYPIFLAIAVPLFTSEAEPPELQVQSQTELSWQMQNGRSYQVQRNVSGTWANEGSQLTGNGLSQRLTLAVGSKVEDYRVMETTPGQPIMGNVLNNGGFETGSGNSSTGWTATGTGHSRISDDVFAGAIAHRVSIAVAAASAQLSQQRPVIAGQSYTFEFQAKQLARTSSYVQQYVVQWLGSGGSVISSTGNVSYSGGTNQWSVIRTAALTAPANAVNAKVQFYFATGAVSGASGGVLLDEVQLLTQTGETAGDTQPIATQQHELAVARWSSETGKRYQPFASLNLTPWTPLTQQIGNGSILSAKYPAENGRAFFKVIFDDETNPGGTGEITPLFNSATIIEPEVQQETATALITRMADRARDRHAREDVVNGIVFRKYDHYLSFYWEQRIAEIEIEDRVAKGGSGLTFTFTTHDKLNPAEFRTFYANSPSVAVYHNNLSDESGQGVTLVSTTPSTRYPGETEYRYTATISQKKPENRALQIGDRMEVELSQFLLHPRHGRTNYYGTAFLYVVGQGVLPWYAKMKEEALGQAAKDAASFDSYPLPTSAWLGGRTTLPYQYSNEPQHRFKQMAGNIAPDNGHAFMFGRRLHHTDFATGAHSESGNPIFAEHVGKIGPTFIATSCIACHTNNGRSLLPAVGTALGATAVVKVGRNALGEAHPTLGEQIQPNSTAGSNVSAETSVLLSGWETSSGNYADGTTYTLKKPQFTFSGLTPAPEFFSVRVAPPLVGLGLLEAVEESTILALADPNDIDGNGISGRPSVIHDLESPTLSRLGRFTPKGSQATVKQQIATAFNRDMGVASALVPILDGQLTSSSPEITDSELQQLSLYVSLLGVSARRQLTDAAALRGESLFQTTGCASCHVPQLTTSPHHPHAELRSQTIYPYTDLLLHDMGVGLADSMGEKGAAPSEWRTTPLWSIGLTAGISGGEGYLHDGRASTLEEAILWHGGEAQTSQEAFRNLPATDRQALIQFLRSL